MSFVGDLECTKYVHDAICPQRAVHNWETCPVRPRLDTVRKALAVLTERPRDAAAVRLILHDDVCLSDHCVGEVRVEHARRTQSRAAAALRRWRRFQ